MTTIQIFRKMFDYLVANKLIPNQTELARRAGLNEVSVSRILNGQVKSTKQETLWKVNTAFGNIFNPEWMRCESDVMLLEDIALVSTDMSAATTIGVSTEATQPDVTASLLAAKDETIASLKRELASKDETIAAKDAVITTKDALIDTLRQQITDLRMQTALEKRLSEAGHSQSASVEKTRPGIT